MRASPAGGSVPAGSPRAPARFGAALAESGKERELHYHTAFAEGSKLMQEEQAPHRKENKRSWSNLLR